MIEYKNNVTIKEQDGNCAKPLLADSRFVPMLFSTDMVKAILNGTKTETRRIIDVDNSLDFMGFIIGDTKRNGQVGFGKDVKIIKNIKPKVNVGDILWVRETFFDATNIQDATLFKENSNIIYKSDETFIGCHKWKPSLFMPKKYCRMFLKVVSVSVERLHDIDEQSAINEGVQKQFSTLFDDYRFKDYANVKSDWRTAIGSFQSLWASINGVDNWDLNPFVWVYKFQRTDEPHGFR